MSHTTVSGAYGRTYKTGAAARADWFAGKDFITRGLGRSLPINKTQADEENLTVNIRFNDDRGVVVIQPRSQPPKPRAPKTKAAPPVAASHGQIDLTPHLRQDGEK